MHRRRRCGSGTWQPERRSASSAGTPRTSAAWPSRRTANGYCQPASTAPCAFGTLQTGQELQRFDGPGNFVEAVAFTPDGQRAICCYGSRNAETIYEEDPSCSLRLWDLATGKVLKQFRGHGAPILSLAISGDGRFLV